VPAKEVNLIAVENGSRVCSGAGTSSLSLVVLGDLLGLPRRLGPLVVLRVVYPYIVEPYLRSVVASEDPQLVRVSDGGVLGSGKGTVISPLLSLL
jgi:hypothetical protein